LIFESLEGDFSAVLGKFGADLKSLELFWFQGPFFCRFSGMLGKAWQQDGAKWGCSAVRLFGYWVFGGGLFGDSAVRLFGCLAVRWLGGSAVRLFS
jgi:hypothetical protein